MPERPASVEAARAGVAVVGGDCRVALGHRGGELPVADGAGRAAGSDPLEPAVPLAGVRQPDLEADLGAGLRARHARHAAERDVLDRKATGAEGLGRREGRRHLRRDGDRRVRQTEVRPPDCGACATLCGGLDDPRLRRSASTEGGIRQRPERGAGRRQEERAQHPGLHVNSLTRPHRLDGTTPDRVAARATTSSTGDSPEPGVYCSDASRSLARAPVSRLSIP